MKQKILVIRYRFIGDTILTVPFIRNLKELYPDSSIDILVGPQSGQVLENCPYINELIIFDTTRFHKYDSSNEKTKSFFYYLNIIKQKKYDMVFCLKRSLGAKLLSFLSGARKRYGYKTSFLDNLFYTKAVPQQDNQNEILSTLEILKLDHNKNYDTDLEYWLAPSEEAEIIEMVPILKNNTSIKVLIHAAAAHEDKLYPLELFSKVILALAKNYDIIPLFTGQAIDRPLYQDLELKLPFKCINLAGKLNLRQSMALYKHLNLAICTDSGPAHLTRAANIPTLILFGPTNPIRWGPLSNDTSLSKAIFRSDLPCRPCNYHKTCVNRECLTELNPQLIIEAARSILNKEEN